MSSKANKSSIRTKLKHTLERITPEQAASAIDTIATNLLSAPKLSSASTILAYAAFGAELSLDPLITTALDAKKTIAIPEIDWTNKSISPRQITNLHTDLIPGRYDIRVPAQGCPLVEPKSLDAILLPGLAFDRAGNRLGRGAGFYDRFISSLHDAGHRPALIGVCYHAQIVDSVPTEPHDHRVDHVITELGPLDLNTSPATR